MKQQICILGSTGSIGTQALDVISQHPDLYEAYALTANHRWKELAEQARRFNPAAVVIADEAYYEPLKQELADMPDVKVYAGSKALEDIVESPSIDMVLTAMVGYSGLAPTIHAIKAKKKICLANKETLVVAGELILQLAQQYHVPILPVDSEHSAIFQSLVGEDANEIEKILLTCSGGLLMISSALRIFSSVCCPSSHSIPRSSSIFLYLSLMADMSETKTSKPSFFASIAAPAPLSPAPSITILFIYLSFPYSCLCNVFVCWLLTSLRVNGYSPLG